MDLLTLIILIIVLVPLLYLFYYWANSEILNDDEINELAVSQRFWDTYNYLGFAESQFGVNKEFKSTLNKNGQLYDCNESLNNFPSIASALLKGKKHEWIIFAFAKNKVVYSFYTNKGSDNQSVSPNLSSDYINKLAKNGGADMVLEFHNHPNGVLSASQQDISSANYFGEIFTNNRLNFTAFVSGTGRFRQYGWWFTENFFEINIYIELIKKENGTSRRVNFDFRQELKKKKHFKDYCLNNSSHNLKIQRDSAHEQKENFNNIISKETKMDYLEKVLKLFKCNLKLFPEQNYTSIEKMENMGDGNNEMWNKYYYKLSFKELGIFEDLELIDHSDIHKSFIFSSNAFSINNMKDLVSIFFKILGKDSIGRGEFNDTDYEQITTQNFWFGRMWAEYEKYNCAIMISFDNEGPTLSLSVKW